MSRSRHAPRHSTRPGRPRHGALVGGTLVLGVLTSIGMTVAAGSPSAALRVATAQISAEPSGEPTIDVSEQRREQALSRSAHRERRASERDDRAEERVRRAHAKEQQRGTQEPSGGRDADLPVSRQRYSDEELAIIRKDPKPWGRELAFEAGFSDKEWMCLHDLWVGESEWEWDATNSTSGAYGIAQALPARKMRAIGSDWRTNPITQMQWGIDYIEKSYGDPCSALEFWSQQDPHWY